MSHFHILATALIFFQAKAHIIDGSHFDFFPALAANIDHTTIHTDPFHHGVVRTGCTELKSFGTNLCLLALKRCDQPRPSRLHAPPQAAATHLTATDTLKHLDALPKRQ